MLQGVYTILENREIAPQVMKLVLAGDTSAITAPGQFVNIQVDGCFLRRPISVCDWDEQTITLVYKIVGDGTLAMSRMAAGAALDVLTGLGNGYDIEKSGVAPLLIGGGAGIPPMYHLCKQLLQKGCAPTVILGFNTAGELFLHEAFQALGVPVVVTTVDGSMGQKGYVTDAMTQLNYTYFYTCGPMPMFQAIQKVAVTSGQFSFEERMGCGFGACMGCSCKTKYGSKRICKDGPVLEREEIIW